MTSSDGSTSSSTSSQQIINYKVPVMGPTNHPLRSSISEILESLLCVEVEKEAFTEIGCYIYRASVAVMELQTSENTPENAMDVMQSVSSGINKARELVKESRAVSRGNAGSELEGILLEMQSVIRQLGECLSLIPSSKFRDQEFAEVAVRSLSTEMQKVQLQVSQIVQTKEQVQLQAAMQQEPKAAAAAMQLDLYAVELEVSTDNSQVLDMPQLVEFLKETSASRSRKTSRQSLSAKSLPWMAECIEPMYGSFYCPLTKQVMEEPVTIESGVTYEKKAIAIWFEENRNLQEIFCPTTGQKLLSRALMTNVALKTTIEEWKERNEAAKIKVSRAALSLASSPDMLLEAIAELQRICRRRPYNKIQVRNAGVVQSLAGFLEYKDRNVRCAAVELLLELAADDDGKEMIAEMVEASTVIRMLSSGFQPIRQATLLLLLELSKSGTWSEKIGSIPGGILMLIRLKYNQLADAFSSEKAEEILRNLQSCPENVKQMAENGFVEPLLNHLTEGTEEVQSEMANCLADIALGQNTALTYVAEKVCPALIRMVKDGNVVSRKAAFRALERISSHHANARTLQEAGIIQVMVEEMFNRRIYNEPMNSISEAAATIANLFDAGIEIENLEVSSHGHKLESEYILYNMIHMLKNTAPEVLNLNLLRLLLCLTRSPTSIGIIVSLIKETEASYTLVELINNPHEELGVAAIKLLIALSPYMGHTLVERLCRIRGQPENLIFGRTETNHITERQAFSVKFLAKLPHQNLTLNLALANKDTVPTILQIINQIQRTGTRTSRYATPYLEGLIGILVRFTATLYEPQILILAKTYNLTLFFTELLMETSSDEVQRLSAIGLENLSTESINLSRPPRVKKTKFPKLFYLPKFLSFASSKKRKLLVCPVHKGACSSQETFCLVDAKAVERLLACLDHENVDVVEAALTALCTLLDDRVDVDKSVSLLTEADTIRHVLNIVRQHDQEGIRQQSFWVIEKFLKQGGDKSTTDISQDRTLLSSLVTAFHYGDGTTKQMAEKILRHLNKMPNFHTTYYT